MVGYTSLTRNGKSKGFYKNIGGFVLEHNPSGLRCITKQGLFCSYSKIVKRCLNFVGKKALFVVIEEQVFSFLKCNFKKLPGEKTRDFPTRDFVFRVADECLSKYCNSKETLLSLKILVYMPGTWVVFDTRITSLLIPGL